MEKPFHFDITITPAKDQGPAEIHILRHNLQALLDTVVLTCKGREVTVDGFKLLGREELFPLFPATEE